MSNAFPKLLDEARALLPEAIALRRRIHENPELGLVLPNTLETVLEALEGSGCEVSTGGETSGVVATLRGGRPGETILLRADMDALPMQEDTGLPFASRREGAMHACGHDAHTAMLAGALQLLCQHKSELSGTVKFLFQPGEEGHGGARVMIGEGLLDAEPAVDAAFAIHVDPTLRCGSVATRPGPILAAADVFSLDLSGRGGHASMPHHALDPIPVACEVVTAIQGFVTRQVDAFDPAVISVTKIQAGTTHNVIPQHVHLLGTIRTVSEGTRDKVHAGLAQLVEGIAGAHGLEARLSILKGYPVTRNDAEFAGLTRGIAQDLVGPDQVIDMPAPYMGAEDFSYVLQRVPGAMVFLGAKPAGGSEPLHSNRMVLEESAMATGIALHAAVALGYLSSAGA